MNESIAEYLTHCDFVEPKKLRKWIDDGAFIPLDHVEISHALMMKALVHDRLDLFVVFFENGFGIDYINGLTPADIFEPIYPENDIIPFLVDQGLKKELKVYHEAILACERGLIEEVYTRENIDLTVIGSLLVTASLKDRSGDSFYYLIWIGILDLQGTGTSHYEFIRRSKNQRLIDAAKFLVPDFRNYCDAGVNTIN